MWGKKETLWDQLLRLDKTLLSLNDMFLFTDFYLQPDIKSNGFILGINSYWPKGKHIE